ncbi:MAG: cysteine desulfurase family protein [bacterium]|nr:cysteine desulfurase family protein [bacterium]
MNERFYFDYAASTPVNADVYKAMEPYFSRHYGNAGALHSFGQEAMAAVDLSRSLVANALGAQFRDIIFTGSATEANNLALRGVLKGSRVQGLGSRAGFRVQGSGSSGQKKPLNPSGYTLYPRIIISAIEHESVLETACDLEREGIAEVIYLPVDKKGIVDMKKLRAALNDRTVLVSIMYVNNEIGSIQPISEISKIVSDFRERSMVNGQQSMVGAALPLLHTDAVQAFQFFDCNPVTLGVDLMTISAHKIYGPKGVGALYVGSRVQGLGSGVGSRAQGLGSSSDRNSLNPIGYTLYPIITGGGQEYGFRSGTENVPLIVGFGVAASHAAKYRAERKKHIEGLKKYFLAQLKKSRIGFSINGGAPSQSAPNIVNLSFRGRSAGDMLTALDMRGIAVSFGAACRSRSSKPSYVLTALGYEPLRASQGVRVSFGEPTTKKEIDALVGALKKIK